MDIDKLNEICAEIAERVKEEQKKPMDFDAILKMYEEDSKKIRY